MAAFRLVICAGAGMVTGTLMSMGQQPGSHVPAQDARNTEIITTDTHLALPQFSRFEKVGGAEGFFAQAGFDCSGAFADAGEDAAARAGLRQD